MKSKICNLKHYVGVILLVIIATGFTSCEKNIIDPPRIDPNIQISFQNDILPIFSKGNCTDCHPSIKQLDLQPTNAYQSLIDGRINLTNPELSKLYVIITTESIHIPKVNDTDKQKILVWIQQGAINN